MPKISRPARSPLQRNLRRRRLGGVCAGLADFFRINVTLVRFFFLLLVFGGVLGFFTNLFHLRILTALLMGGLGFGTYLALWFLMPASSETPIPKVSHPLARKLRHIDGLIRKLHRRHDPRVADLAQETFESLKLLAPRFDDGAVSPPDEELKTAALETFPKVLDRVLSFPPRSFAVAGDSATPASVLIGQLEEVRTQLQQAANSMIEKEFEEVFRKRKEDSPQLIAWREQLDPVLQQLHRNSGPTTLGALQHIEEKLAFLLERLDEGGELFDLRPFEVRKIAFEYLPDALNQYLALPPSMARTQKLGSGKTAEEALNEQLNLLDTALYDLARSLFEKDAGGLMVHGRFLREKFAEQPFRLDERT